MTFCGRRDRVVPARQELPEAISEGEDERLTVALGSTLRRPDDASPTEPAANSRVPNQRSGCSTHHDDAVCRRSSR